jgi:uncharacterized protein
MADESPESVETSEPERKPGRSWLAALAPIAALGALEYARRRFLHERLFLPAPITDGKADPADFGLEPEDIHFASEDGTKLHGWWLTHPQAEMTMVYCHGNRGNIADRVDVLRWLLRFKTHVFAFDYRGYGKSAGKPSEEGLFADVRAALDELVKRGIPLERIILLGHSLGGAVAIDGAFNRPVAGLIVQSSFTQLKDMARHRYPDLPLHLITSHQFRSIEKVPHLAMPKLFIHGTADEVIPFHHGEKLFAAAAEPKHFLSVGGASHQDVHLKGSLRYLYHISRFRRFCADVAASQVAPAPAPEST